MSRKHILFFIFSLLGVLLSAQSLPTAQPKMWVTGDDLVHADVTDYNGNAPMTATFEANADHVGQYQAIYEWTWRKMGSPTPLLKRFEANTTYEFRESGNFEVSLKISFIQAGSDTIVFEMDEPFRIAIAESHLEVPNAFTPNGDGVNDVFKVKEGYRSIVKFEAQVFNRWGKKLYQWKDISKGWDGKQGSREAPDGAYYLRIEAVGADGKKYHIRKTINLLRHFDETRTTVE